MEEAALISPLGRTVLGTTAVTIGRALGNMLVLADVKVLDYHAEIRLEGSYYVLVDLSNGNGTFVNGQQVYSGVPCYLQPGDVIHIGDTALRFVVGSGVQGVSSEGYSGMSTTVPIRPPGIPNNLGNTAYGMDNYAGTPSSPIQSPAYPNAQMPIHASSHGQQRSPTIMIVSGVIAVIIIIASVGGFFTYQNNVVVPSIHATATAQTQAQATASVQNAAATSLASTDLTATAVATSPYMPFTNVALDNSLTTTTSSIDWNVSSSCQFSTMGYQISIAQNNEFHWCLNSGQYGEMAYQVAMTIHQGDCGGLLFRYLDTNNFYEFEVCQDGTYNLGDYINGQSGSLGFQTSSAIKRGLDVQNSIAVTVQGDTVNMYVNGSHIDTATNSGLMSSTFSQGRIGLIADDEGNPTSVIYTNALVWTA